jgi:hypothetical protein
MGRETGQKCEPEGSGCARGRSGAASAKTPSIRYTLAIFDIIQYMKVSIAVELFKIFPFRLPPPCRLSPSSPRLQLLLAVDRHATNALKENGMSRSFLSAVQLTKLLFAVTA